MKDLDPDFFMQPCAVGWLCKLFMLTGMAGRRMFACYLEMFCVIWLTYIFPNAKPMYNIKWKKRGEKIPSNNCILSSDSSKSESL